MYSCFYYIYSCFYLCFLTLNTKSSTMSHQLNEGHILALGSPLLDLIATVTSEFLTKYKLEPNNAIPVDQAFMKQVSADLIQNFKVDYIAGGTAQNTVRVAQWFFHKPKLTSFFGVIGADQFGEQMRRKLTEDDRVIVCYHVDTELPTGVCVCLITDKSRSMCAYRGASLTFPLQHLKDNFKLVEAAKIIYTTGFHLGICFDTQMLLAEHAHANEGKIFSLNLSATYISERFSEELKRILPYVDNLFGNDSDAQALSHVLGWLSPSNSNIADITQKIADFRHKRPRIVVITQGAQEVLVAISGNSTMFQRFKVPQMDENRVLDTTGAGDSFVGGFLAYKALAGKSIQDCVEAGIYAATEVIQLSGCTLPVDNKFRL